MCNIVLHHNEVLVWQIYFTYQFIDEDGYTTLATILGVDGRRDTVAPIAERLHPQYFALSLANIAKVLYTMLMSVHVDLAQHGGEAYNLTKGLSCCSARGLPFWSNGL